MELPLEMEISRAASQFFWSLQNKYNTLLKPFGLTIEQWRLLVIISYYEGTDQQFLAEQTMKVKSAITALLAKMGKAGLIARITDEKDGRNKKVYLTEKGKMLVEQGKSLLFKESKRVIENVDKEKLEQMIRTMQELTEKLQ